MKEIWKDVVGFEGLYQVSNYGRVRSLANDKYRKEKIRKLGRIAKKSGNAYYMVTLCKDGKTNNKLVHRLVAEAFIPNPDNLPQVNHIDENGLNNRVDNLEWCSCEYNNNYGTHCQRMSKTKSIEVEQWSLDGELIKVWSSQQEIKRILGFHQSNISKCCNGERHTAHDFVWRYKEPESTE